MRRIPFRLLLLALLSAACASNGEVAELDERLAGPGDFIRAPYMVTVTDSSAIVRWRSSRPVQPGFRFWAEDGDTLTETLPATGLDHTFEMVDLVAATTYFYQVRVQDTIWTEAVEFRTFPEPGSREPFTFLAMGDTGTLSSGQVALAAQINQEEAALIIHMGDVAYPDGTEQELTDKHFAVYGPILKRVPFYPAPGDHDMRVSWGEPYINAFTPPEGRPSGSPLYYSFTHDNVRFIALDSQSSEEHAARFGYVGDPSSEQYQWLLLELSEARADPAIDWTVVFFHHGPYSASTGFGGHGSDLAVRQFLAPLMDGYGVPIVFTGHDHDYQRSRPIRGNEVVPENEGTVYVVSGGGGGRRTFRGTGADWFTEYADQIYEYVRVRVDHYTMSVEAVDVDGNVFDSFELTIPEELRKPFARESVPLTMPGQEEDAAEEIPEGEFAPAGGRPAEGGSATPAPEPPPAERPAAVTPR
ncbi:MAG TPA: metallophosphoesterase family protein [Gemmatimonadota bacterium]|nr:metallophosphoesterase family protein [Gemmatimonadota bacterium]